MKENKKLNIAQITPYYYPAVGGIEKATYQTSVRLAKKGHEVTVYTSQSNFDKFNTLPREETIDGIKIKRFPEHFHIMSTWFPKINKGEDILHFRNYNINPHTYLLKKYYTKKPTLVTFHGGFSREEGDFSFRPTIYGTTKFLWQYFYGKRYLKKIDKLLALHGWEKKNLIEKGAPESRIEIVPNGIEDEAFMEYHPIKFDKPYILSLCRISRVKSLDHVIKVLPDIRDIYYVIAGDDIGEGEIDKLKKLAEELNVNDRVKFVGSIKSPEKYNYISGALAVIVPSQWEMLSHTILESMAQGKIVIASNSFGNPYIIDENDNGLIYKYGDLEKLKNILTSVIDNPNQFINLQNSAKKKLWDSYRWDAVVDNIEKLYFETLKKYNAT